MNKLTEKQLAIDYIEFQTRIKSLEKLSKSVKKEILGRAMTGIKFDEFGLTVYSSRGTDMNKTEQKWMNANKQLPTKHIERVVIEAHDEVNYPMFKAIVTLEENKELLVLKKESWKIRVKK